MQVLRSGRFGGDRVLNIDDRVIFTFRHQPVTGADEVDARVAVLQVFAYGLFELRTHQWHGLIRENLISALDQVPVDAIALRLEIGGGGGEENLFRIDGFRSRRTIARFLVVHRLEQLADLVGEVEDF